MDIRVLKYFLEVIDKGSIAKAADSMLTTAPNISRQIKNLEEELGVKLFDKSGKYMELTEDGLFLKTRAREIVALYDRTENDIKNKEQEISGTVYIGAAETYSMHSVGKTIKKLSASHPGVKFHIQSGSSETVTDGLDSGIFDFGILMEPVDISKYGHIKFSTPEQWGVLMRKDHPLAELPSIRPNDLEDIPLMCSAQMIDGNGLSGWLGKDTNSLSFVLTYNLITTPTMMVEEGVGCALTLKDLVQTKWTELTFRRLNPKIETSLFLVWRQDQKLSRAAMLFLETFHASSI